jgi:hypothetical protein
MIGIPNSKTFRYFRIDVDKIKHNVVAGDEMKVKFVTKITTEKINDWHPEFKNLQVLSNSACLSTGCMQTENKEGSYYNLMFSRASISGRGCYTLKSSAYRIGPPNIVTVCLYHESECAGDLPLEAAPLIEVRWYITKITKTFGA